MAGDSELEAMLVEAKEAPRPLADGCPAPFVPKLYRDNARPPYTHDALCDLMIAQPSMTQNALAAHFGYTAAWVSTILASDAFQAKYAERVATLVDPAIKTSLEERFKGMASRSLAILMEKLEPPAAQVPTTLALRAFELSTRAAGFGARAEPSHVPVNVNLHLEGLSENLVRLLRKAKVDAGGQTFDADSPRAKLGVLPDTNPEVSSG